MIRSLLTSSCCIILLSGCAGARPNATAHVAGGEVALYVMPAVSGENNDVRVDISGTAPQPSAFELDMADMHMAQRLPLRREGAKRYSASNVRFSMAGTWRVRVLNARGERISSFMIAVR